MGPRVRLDEVEKRKFLTLPGLELQTLGRAASSQPLNRLSYPGFLQEEGSARKDKEWCSRENVF
jgi:hypothetical protein